MSTRPIEVDPSPEPVPSYLETTPPARASYLRWLLPIVVILVGSGIAWLLIFTKKSPEPRDPVATAAVVRTQTLAPTPFQFEVVAHGTVTPRTESDLVAEVRGRVIEVSPKLVAGSFFEQGDALLRFDDREYRIAVDRAQANLKLRASEFRLAQAEFGRRRELSERGAASIADLEQFESRAAVAAASRDGARAALDQAKLDLERTILRAPFDGRVRTRDVDVGQFVNPGHKIGRLYAIDFAEVKLAVPTSDLAYLDVPIAGSSEIDLPVTLSATIGEKEQSWAARLVRTEGDIDLRTRMLTLVARIEDPFVRNAGTSHSPLPTGLFVRAVVGGSSLENAYVLPLMALRDNNHVFLMDDDDRLEVRRITILRETQEHIVIAEGLENGERVVVSPLRVYSDGMQLRTLDSEDIESDAS